MPEALARNAAARRRSVVRGQALAQLPAQRLEIVPDDEVKRREVEVHFVGAADAEDHRLAEGVGETGFVVAVGPLAAQVGDHQAAGGDLLDHLASEVGAVGGSLDTDHLVEPGGQALRLVDLVEGRVEGWIVALDDDEDLGGMGRARASAPRFSPAVQPRGSAPHCAFERVHRHRLHQVMVEAGGVGLGAVAVLSIAGEGDQADAGERRHVA
jgi:hypothetical protein